MSKKVIGVYTHRGFIPYEESALIPSNISADKIVTNSLRKQGNFVICNFSTTEWYTDYSNLTFPKGFAPKEAITAYGRGYSNSTLVEMPVSVHIRSTGIEFEGGIMNGVFELVNIGWEAEEV